MKIMTILGTRPEIIRLSRIIPKLDASCEHMLVHTGQNYDHNLSDVFFNELGIRAPDHYLAIRANSPAQQIGTILAKTEALFLEHKPDRLFILGDTNSGLSAIIAKRLGITIYHAEAGNRCFDYRVPEETNRRIIDQCSDVLMPYTSHSKAYLLNEGYHPSTIHVTGNPIGEVINHYMPDIDASQAITSLKLTPKNYILVTLHRAENVDCPDTLSMYLQSFEQIAADLKCPVIVSTHPRLRDKLHGSQSDIGGVTFLPPFGFFDFIQLQRQARLVLTDSGTVQEESCILHVPCVTLRRTTERPETLEAGSNILASKDSNAILEAARFANDEHRMSFDIPDDYTIPNVSERITDLLVSE